MADYAYRRISTKATGYRKIEATIHLPNSSDITIASGQTLYNYVGMRKDTGATFDFEFGFGYDPGAGLGTQFCLYRSIVPGIFQYETFRANPGTKYRLLIASENGTIKCYVYDSKNAEVFQKNYIVANALNSGSGQVVRRMSTLIVPTGGSAVGRNNRWSNTLVATSTTNNYATSSNCNQENITSPPDQPWISVTPTNPYYNETVNLDIR
ncbi:hypothetical protein ABDB91_17275 [Desulfoscipio sp. XC116]|uniref:hypothetical protein n=1 Tax=Desulfoscipio sp. XC116 TaxID=3144975 RepID=UPI00325B3FC2